MCCEKSCDSAQPFSVLCLKLLCSSLAAYFWHSCPGFSAIHRSLLWSSLQIMVLPVANETSTRGASVSISARLFASVSHFHGFRFVLGTRPGLTYYFVLVSEHLRCFPDEFTSLCWTSETLWLRPTVRSNINLFGVDRFNRSSVQCFDSQNLCLKTKAISPHSVPDCP